MTLVVDAGPLVDLGDRRSTLAPTILRIIETEPGSCVLPAFVAAEADHLIGTRLGHAAERAFLRDLASGVYVIETLTGDEQQLVVELDEDYPGLGLADLSIVVLAARHRTKRILTFDERDFRRLRPLDGGSFTLLPADADG